MRVIPVGICNQAIVGSASIMDGGGRYALRQAEWDNGSSALSESYDAVRNIDLRSGAAAYTGGGRGGGGGYLDGEFERESGYPRDPYPREILYERDVFGMSPSVLGLWHPPAKRRHLDDEVALLREVHRHEKVGFVNTLPGCSTFDRNPRCSSRDRDSYDGEDYDYVRRPVHGSREGSRDVELDFPSRYRGSDSEDRERSRRERDWRHQQRREERDWNRSRSRSPRERNERNRDDWSLHDHDSNYFRDRNRSRSVSHDDSRRRSRSHRSTRHERREDSISDGLRQETGRSDGSRENPREGQRESSRNGRSSNHERPKAALNPSATLVVKGLSQKTIEDDLYLALENWGPLRHVRVIKERNSGVSRGFAFVDFPSMEGAKKMMDAVGYDGLVVDGRRLFFEYSSKPTSGLGGGTQQGTSSGRGGGGSSRGGATGVGTDWMCTVCGCVNFARRVLCFQCNEGRAEDAPAADVSALTGGSASGGRRSSEAGPTHVLVVRGLDESVTEETLRDEFSKYAPIKDLRLVRDKFTQVSRGFAFVHFNSVDEAAKALEGSNGTPLEKSGGHILRVAFAKSIYGPGSSAPGATPSQGSQAAQAAIEAATFSQQYDNTGWAPKEYNPEQDAKSGSGYSSFANHHSTPETVGSGGENGRAPHHKGGEGGANKPGSLANKGATTDEVESQSGFVWDAASGYYYDAASGFYYDGHRGLYYDGNSGLWYTYDQETQQYAQYVEPVSENTGDVTNAAPDTTADGNVHSSKAVISAPAVVSLDAVQKKPTLAEAVIAAAVAAQVAAKKEKERVKEKEKEKERDIRLAGKGPVMVSKKKISNAMNQWKQRQTESQAPRQHPNESSVVSAVVSSDSQSNATAPITSTDSANAGHQTSSLKYAWGNHVKDNWGSSLGRGAGRGTGFHHTPVGIVREKSTIGSNSTRLTESKVSTVGSDLANSALGGLGKMSPKAAGRGGSMETGGSLDTAPAAEPMVTTPFKTNASALGSYSPMAGVKRRFTETPQTGYRDRAAERRNLHGSSVLVANSLEADLKEKGLGVKGRGLEMPFPPGVGTKASANGALPGPEVPPFEVISAEKAIDERNVGNRMLRNMGWQEGSGLGKQSTGIVEPVQAQGTGERAGLGSATQRKSDSRFETQPGDTYRIVIQKKALARFHEMI